MCKVGKMFYEDSLISNTTARCNENANWSFDSSKLSCYRGLVLAYEIIVKNVYLKISILVCLYTVKL